MPDDLRITPDELKRRMQSGEQFTIIDTRNPQAWAEATDMAPGAVRFHGDNVEGILPRLPRAKPIIAYCT
jgi:rhodanese-related sulfurtransferase